MWPRWKSLDVSRATRRQLHYASIHPRRINTTDHGLLCRRGERRFCSVQTNEPVRGRPHESLTSTPTLSDAQRRTIYALSTPPGKGGIAVVRVSGPCAVQVYRAVTRSARFSPRSQLKKGAAAETPRPWVAEFRDVVDPVTDEKLDDGIVLFFQGEYLSHPLIHFNFSNVTMLVSEPSMFRPFAYMTAKVLNHSPRKTRWSSRCTRAEPCSRPSFLRFPSFPTAAPQGRASSPDARSRLGGWT